MLYHCVTKLQRFYQCCNCIKEISFESILDLIISELFLINFCVMYVTTTQLMILIFDSVFIFLSLHKIIGKQDVFTFLW